MEERTASLDDCISQLDGVAPDAPLLALGQTVLWDEPMKAGVALALQEMGSGRKFLAGVHDTDYFAKLPSGAREPGKFVAVPHNATTTRDLWSAAGEFSALFGSETVITRQDFKAAGLNLEKVLRSRPGILDEASEAFGWRGLVSLDENPPVVAEMSLRGVFPALFETFEWAIRATLECVFESSLEASKEQADRLLELVCDRANGNAESLSEYYRELLPDLYSFAAGKPVPVEATATTELLRFNLETCELPRFEPVGLFLDPESRKMACDAYDRAIADSEIYPLARFGTGAIPFDLYIPSQGRGTIQLGDKSLIVGTPESLAVDLEAPIGSLRDLAEAVERTFGPGCALIGKAVTFISMLSREYVFVFHEGASGYVKYTRKFHELLAEGGSRLEHHPILRLRYSPWDALKGCCAWLKLPEPLAKAFQSEDICAPSFANRWRQVSAEQRSLLNSLGAIRSPMDLIRFLDDYAGGSWNRLAIEYGELHERLSKVSGEVRMLKQGRMKEYARLRDLKRERMDLERTKGEHFRAHILERGEQPERIAEREEFEQRIRHAADEIAAIRERIKTSVEKQRRIVRDPSVLEVHERRRAIELEAELKRMRLIRSAVVASRGLERAGHRPSAWWFPLVCPTHHWFANAVASAECYLEPLVSKPGAREKQRVPAASS